MRIQQLLSAMAVGAAALAGVISSSTGSESAERGPTPVLVTNAASEPIPVTGEVKVRPNGVGFTAKAFGSDSGAELSLIVNGPLNGRFDPIVIENASVRVNAPSDHAITVQILIYPPSGQLEEAAVSYLPLVPQGSFGIRTLYVANEALRLYSAHDPGSIVAFIFSCSGCGADDLVSANVSIAGQTNP